MSSEDEEAVPHDDLTQQEQRQEEEHQQQQLPGSVVHTTLQHQGPQHSAGSGGHPEACMPCTFYCFTRRGCNRGLECRFCHLTHQSKLQQRRENWKKQQREKRKTMRERMASEVRMSKELPVEAPAAAQPRHAGKHSSHPTPSRDDGHGNGGSALPPKGAPTTPSGNAAPGEQGGGVMLDGVQCSSQSGVAAFGYYPAQATLTIGQETAFRPQLASKPCRFRPLTQMPKGLVLDPASGVISGAPAEAVTQTVMFIEAEFSNGGVGRAVVEFEVVDLTRGGFVVGHVSEFEPGMFMMLLYIPDGDEPGYSAVPPHLHGGTGNMKGLAPWDGRTAVQKSVASMGQPVIWPQAMSCGRALGQLSNGHSPSQNVAWGRECPSSEDWW